MTSQNLWERFQKYFLRYDDLGFSLDISRMRFSENFFFEMGSRIESAFQQMKELETGAISNPDEGRMVGHYWLRSPQLAPNDDLRTRIEATNFDIKSFAEAVHSGRIQSPNNGLFKDVVVIGIGGSALGPQFVADALGGSEDLMNLHFLDNTDPDGFDKVLDKIESRLPTSLILVISKSGGTKETRNGMLETATRFKSIGLNFAKHAVAITGDQSELDSLAVDRAWLKRFPMWDWVGGRTSVMSSVGLVPAALQGINVDQFLAGASAMDQKTRLNEVQQNAAMLLALMWHFSGNGHGEKDMVILPYKDRLVLLSKYLQQLVMESLGKEHDVDGRVVNQGIAVYGNKGSTDQHAYVQQMREGIANFFATFIEVRQNREGDSMQVDPGVTSGDYLQGFLRGTRSALYDNNRDSITISISKVTAFSVGALIALYERAVGYYAALVNINAYHQPGVEAGKKAASKIVELQIRVRKALEESPKKQRSVMEIADMAQADAEDVYHVLNHWAANSSNFKASGERPDNEKFWLE